MYFSCFYRLGYCRCYLLVPKQHNHHSKYFCQPKNIMKIYKFGGASVKDANGVINVASIINKCHEPLVVVVSAMGKTTNALEVLVDNYISGNKQGIDESMDALRLMHQQTIDELFGQHHAFQTGFERLLDELADRLAKQPTLNYDFDYDQIVPFGELISTAIVSAYLNHVGINSQWIDIRNVIKTDDNYRNPAVLWELTAAFVKNTFTFNKGAACYLTQGFVGSTTTNQTTTLGREGSDYTAAILGNLLNAADVTIWKDVPGVLSADPRWYPKAVKLAEISYWEAIELTYHGAQVIHPKTLKPLQNKNIPLYVKSFIDPMLPGTVVRHLEIDTVPAPIFILKPNQLFLTLSPRDFSFIVEDNLSDIFAVFGHHKLAINLMQKSALNFSVCIDKNRKLPELLKALEERYVVRYNDDVELVTVRHYTPEAIAEVTNKKEIIDSQVTRKSARYVVKRSEWRF
jgi:aspartate kinase